MFMKNKITIVTLCLCLGLLLGITGCSKDPAPGKVTGTLTLNGEPVSNAMICFYPDNGSASIGVSDEKGKYELLFTEDRKGAEIGSHKVTISTGRPAERQAATDPNDPSGAVKPGNPAVKESIPSKYVNRETTDLVKEVKAGRQTIDIEISTK